MSKILLLCSFPKRKYLKNVLKYLKFCFVLFPNISFSKANMDRFMYIRRNGFYSTGRDLKDNEC
jgi:hypothetical protein